MCGLAENRIGFVGAALCRPLAPFPKELRAALTEDCPYLALFSKEGATRRWRVFYTALVAVHNPPTGFACHLLCTKGTPSAKPIASLLGRQLKKEAKGTGDRDGRLYGLLHLCPAEQNEPGYRGREQPNSAYTKEDEKITAVNKVGTVNDDRARPVYA